MIIYGVEYFMCLCDLSYREKIISMIAKRKKAKNVRFLTFSLGVLLKIAENVCIFILAKNFYRLRVGSGRRATEMIFKKKKNRIADKSHVQTTGACMCYSIAESKQMKWHRWQHNTAVDKTRIRKTN